MKDNSNFRKFGKPQNIDIKKSLSYIVDPNEDENRSNSGALSDIDDIAIDLNKLNSVKLYSDQNLAYFSRNLRESEIVAEEIIAKIKKEALFLMVENHINSKLPAHSSVLCLEMIDLLINMSENNYCINETQNKETKNFYEDEEPETVAPDNWVRGKIIQQKKENKKVEMMNFSEIEKNIMGTDNYRNMINKVNEKAQNYLNEIKEKYPPQPIDLNEKIRTNEIEEDLRNKKENEQRILQEQKEKERKKDNEIKNQQNELAKMAKEQKAKNFTYDYDGKVILVHGLKNEKFPPPTYLINFNFTQEWPPILSEEEKKKLKKKKAQEILKESRAIQKNKKTPEEEKEFVKNIVTITPPIYDQFTLAPGVTLSMNGKLKVEPRPITATIANITDPTIRMSKTDYFNLTRSGNLSREGLSKTQDNNAKLPIGQNLGKISEEPSYQSGQSKDILLKKEKKKQQKQEKLGEVKISSHIMIENMTKGISEEEEFEIIKKQQEEHKRRLEEIEAKKEKTLLTSPIDKFNMDIISSKDWGRTTFGSNMSGTMKTNPIKPSQKDISQTLGVMTKKPRDRFIVNANPSNSGSRLPPPMIGKTTGHGFINTLSQETFKLPENI